MNTVPIPFEYTFILPFLLLKANRHNAYIEQLREYTVDRHYHQTLSKRTSRTQKRKNNDPIVIVLSLSYTQPLDKTQHK